MRFSIIIPIYNTEKYIDICINSILNQDFKDFELILLNDGSNDNSGNICDTFAKIDSRIILINKENSGASDCRNIGMKKAKGDYILFLDSDDFFVEDCLRKIDQDIYKNMNAEIFMGKFNFYYEDSGLSRTTEFNYDSNKLESSDTDDILAYLLEEVPEQIWSVWRNIYKRDFLISKNLLFNKELILGEDIDFVIRTIIVAENVGSIEYPIVNYRIMRSESITNTLNLKKICDSIFLSRHWINYAKDNVEKTTSKQSIYNRFAYSFAALFLHYSKLQVNEKRQVKKLLKDNDDLLKFSNRRDIKIVNRVYRLLGINITSRLLTIRSKLKA